MKMIQAQSGYFYLTAQNHYPVSQREVPRLTALAAFFFSRNWEVFIIPLT